MLWCVHPPNIYQILTGETVTAPPVPGLYPAYDEAATSTQNTLIQIQWQKQKELADMKENTDLALIQVAKEKLSPTYREQLVDLFVGVPERTFQAFFARVFQKWGRPTPMDIAANTQRMSAPWDPTQDIASLIKQIKDGAVFAYMVNHGKTDKDLVTIGEELILRSGHFATQYQEWKRRPEAEREWADFQTFWTEEYDLWYETSKPASQFGFGGNAMEPQADEKAAAEQAYFDSLQLFGDTNKHNAQAFENMSEQNKELVSNMAAQIQALNKQMEGLACAVQQKNTVPPPAYYQPAQPTYQPQATYVAHTPAPAYQAPPQYQQQPTYQPQAAFGYHQQGYQGRGRGRGRGGGRGGGGRGRGRGYSQGGQQNYQGQGGQQNYQGQGQGFQQQNSQGFYGGQKINAPFSNTTKYFHNWNYCWSHGYDVPDGHTSPTCPNPAPGHVWHATRENPCNGCRKGQHKTTWS
jgi:hypothetical protein